MQAQEGAGWEPTKEKQEETAARLFPLLPYVSFEPVRKTAADVRTHGDDSFRFLISSKKGNLENRRNIGEKRKMNQYLCFDTWE